MKRMTLEQAFLFLVSQKGWRKKISKESLGDHYAGRIRKGQKVPENRMREFLKQAGYQKIQEELWEVTELS